MIGVLSFKAVREEREILPEFLQGQRLLGAIFANALARAQRTGARASGIFVAWLKPPRPSRGRPTFSPGLLPTSDHKPRGFSATRSNNGMKRVSGCPICIPMTRSLRSTLAWLSARGAEDFELEYRMIDSSGRRCGSTTSSDASIAMESRPSFAAL